MLPWVQVLECEVLGYIGPYGGPQERATLRVMLGEPGPRGARAQLEFPYQPRAEAIQVLEPAELLVLSMDETFAQFKVRGWRSMLGLWMLMCRRPRQAHCI